MWEYLKLTEWEGQQTDGFLGIIPPKQNIRPSIPIASCCGLLTQIFASMIQFHWAIEIRNSVAFLLANQESLPNGRASDQMAVCSLGMGS